MEHIAAASLIANGFVSARPLARKVSVLYQLAREQLSAQAHYHFGLGSVAKVLKGVAQMRLDSACKTLTESSIVVRVLSMINLPVLHPADCQLFKNLIKDLFPGVDCPTPGHDQLRHAIGRLTDETSLEYVAVGGQEAKIIELHEVMSMSRATIILGATGSGKTAILDLMMKARNAVAAEDGGRGIRCVTLNPKECDLREFLGFYEEETKLWHDGLFSSIFRDANQVRGDGQRQGKEDQRDVAAEEDVIIRLDGDMDAAWVETLNTVLDNNRMLILANGERLYLSPQNNCSLVFEATHLRNISPATVARCGLVFCDSSAVGHVAYWSRWLRQRFGSQAEENGLRKKLAKLFRTLFAPCLEFVIEGGNLNFQRIQIKSTITQNELGYVRQFCEIFALLLDLQPQPPPTHSAKEPRRRGETGRRDGKVDEVEESEVPIKEPNNNGPGETEPEETERGPGKNLSKPDTATSEVKDADDDDGAGKRDGGSGQGHQGLGDEDEDKELATDEAAVECLFIQALYASCGALIGSPADRGYFDEFIKGRLEDRPIVQDNEQSPAGPGEIPSAYPTLYDYCFDKRSKKWMAWPWLLPRPSTHGGGGGGGQDQGAEDGGRDEEQQRRNNRRGKGDKLAVYDVHVATRDTMRMNFYLSLCNDSSNEMWPVMLLGNTASGKTSLVNHYLQQLESRTTTRRNVS